MAAATGPSPWSSNRPQSWAPSAGTASIDSSRTASPLGGATPLDQSVSSLPR